MRNPVSDAALVGLAAVEPQTSDFTTSRRRVVEQSEGGALLMVTDATTPSLTVRLIRTADQLDLLLELLDVSLDPVTNLLEGVVGGDPRLRVILGAQHTTEDALADVDVVPPTTEPLNSRTAGPSRLVTSIQTPLAFTVDALLDTAAWALRSPVGAGVPSVDLTALELPSGLVLAPDAATSVTTTGEPRTENGVTELWRADLRSPTATALTLRALANVAPTDVVTNPVPSFSARDGIVANTTSLAPAKAPRLTLSSHGAFARLVGDWPDQPVSRWRQTVVTGRDVVAEVVQEGYLLPFGHRVKILQVNSRSFVPDADGRPSAVLAHERFVSIDAPTVVFDDTSGAGDSGMEFRQFEGRGLPFTQVRAVPTEWIPIDTVELHDDGGAIPGVYDLIVKATGQPLIAAFDATDRAGNGNIGFSTPATFVDELEAFMIGTGSRARAAGGVLRRLRLRREANPRSVRSGGGVRRRDRRGPRQDHLRHQPDRAESDRGDRCHHRRARRGGTSRRLPSCRVSPRRR